MKCVTMVVLGAAIAMFISPALADPAAPQAASPLPIETSPGNSNDGNAGSPEGLAGHPITITGWAAAFEIGTARAYDLGDFKRVGGSLDVATLAGLSLIPRNAIMT